MKTPVVVPVADDEYALVRRYLPQSSAGVFDGLRESGRRLGEVADDKTRLLVAWRRAVTAAQNDGLGRYVRVHDLRISKIHHEWTGRGES